MAFIECPSCGERTGNLKTHICRKGKSYDGIPERHKVGAGSEWSEQPGPSDAKRGEVTPKPHRVGKTRQPEPAIGSPAAPIQKRGRGRPKVEGARSWELEGISRRTWYRRRQREQKEKTNG